MLSNKNYTSTCADYDSDTKDYTKNDSDTKDYAQHDSDTKDAQHDSDTKDSRFQVRITHPLMRTMIQKQKIQATKLILRVH